MSTLIGIRSGRLAGQAKSRAVFQDLLPAVFAGLPRKAFQRAGAHCRELRGFLPAWPCTWDTIWCRHHLCGMLRQRQRSVVSGKATCLPEKKKYCFDRLGAVGGAETRFWSRGLASIFCPGFIFQPAVPYALEFAEKASINSGP